MSDESSLSPESLVRQLRASIVAAPAYDRLDPLRRREMDHDLSELLRLLSDDAARVRALSAPPGADGPAPQVPDASKPTEVAPNTNILRTTSSAFGDLVDEVNFVDFVSKLMHGVFDAIVQSSESQMTAYAKMLENVVMSTKDFAETSISETDARSQLLSSFGGLLELGQNGESIVPKDGMHEQASRQFPGLSNWTSPATQTALVTQAKLQLARQRQQLLATMVVMGINRIVVTDGDINAKVQFHVDTKSAASVATGAAALAKGQAPVGETTQSMTSSHGGDAQCVVVSGLDDFTGYNYNLAPGWYIVDAAPNEPHHITQRGGYPVLHLPYWGARAINIPRGWSVQFQKAYNWMSNGVPSRDDRNLRTIVQGPRKISTGSQMPMFKETDWIVVSGPAFRTQGFDVRLSTTNKEPSTMNEAEMTTAASMKGEVDIKFKSQTFPLGKLGPELMGTLEHKAGGSQSHSSSSSSTSSSSSSGSTDSAAPAAS